MGSYVRYELWEGDAGQGNIGDRTVKLIAVFSELSRVFDWLKSRGYTQLSSGNVFRRVFAGGESRLGEKDYEIRELSMDVDPE